jgi:hypothetical protein
VGKGILFWENEHWMRENNGKFTVFDGFSAKNVPKQEILIENQ